MKKRFRLELFIQKTVEFEAESMAEAEDFLVEHLRQFGEVDNFSSFAQEDTKV